MSVSSVSRNAARWAYSERVQKSAAQLLASGDVDALLALHRSTFGDARMDAAGSGGDAGAGGQGREGGAGPAGGAGGEVGPPPAAGVPQDTVNAIVARETEKAKTAALQGLADEWGVSLDDARQIVADHKAGEAAKLTEAEKRERAAAEAETKATAREAAAVARERDATIRAALAEAGVGRDDMTDARRLVDIADGDLDEKAVGTAVEDLKKRRPELFGGTRTTPPAGFTPPGSPTPGAQPSSMAERREHYRKQLEAQKSA